MKPFTGLKVVELASVLAGPAVGMFFAELGAEVVKIENKKTDGDLIRRWKLPCENPVDPFSSYYHAVNWGKQVILADLDKDSDRLDTERRIAQADILLLNFKRGDAKKFGFDNSELRKRYPALIIAEIHGFEDRERVAYDAVLQAESGLMSLNGEPGRAPLKLPVAFVDLLAAHQLKEGVLIALLQRMQTGRGTIVSATLYKSAIASLANQASAYLNTGQVPGRTGSLHPVIAPYGETMPCADGRMILLAIGTNEQFRRLMNILGKPELAADPSFSTNESRVAHRARLAGILSDCIQSRESGELLAACHNAKVPVAAIQSVEDVFKNEAAKSMILQQIEPDGTISKRVSTIAFNLTEDEAKS